MPPLALNRSLTNFGMNDSFPVSGSGTVPHLRPSRTNVAQLPRNKGKRTWRRLLSVASVFSAGILLAVYRPWNELPARPLSPTNVHSTSSLVVSIEKPVRSVTASVLLPATIRPWQTTTLHARVSGYLTAWHYDLGARVKVGALLAEIDTPELDQELAEAQGTVREAIAAAAQARAEHVEA